jgi:hypothetical protein
MTETTSDAQVTVPDGKQPGLEIAWANSHWRPKISKSSSIGLLQVASVRMSVNNRIVDPLNHDNGGL